ncbi:MAG TPA: 1,4-dihydroxy-6-naphthoate synthase, partial [Mycobacteriales bacterium]|nr:1,4-dihydroxy-6-naphthoate synthase [Mycobacteriales bacterium]
ANDRMTETATTHERLTLAHSPCPNDTFVFHAWTHGLVDGAPPVEVTFADVDVSNGAAERGAYDVVKVSYAALPWLLRDYALLPSGGALGRGCGPLVVTAGHRGVAGATVAVPGDRTTAYLLFRLWSAAAPPARVEVVPFAEIMPAVRAGRYDAGLVIHEARFTYPGYGLTCLADLGGWWEAETGLPIPLGAILARRRLDTARLAAVVRESVERAWADPAASAAYVARHAAEMDPDVQRQHIALYVNRFTADLGEEGRAAVGALLDRAAAAGISPPCPPLE